MLIRASVLAALTFMPTVVAQTQIPIPPYVRTFSSPAATRGFWFQTPVPIVVTGLRVPDETMHGMQAVELMQLPSAPPNFPGTISGTQRFYAANVPSSQIIATSVFFNGGDFVGVVGAAGDSTIMHNSYGANGAFASNVLGSPVTLTRFGTQFNIAATGGNNPVWQEPAGPPSRVEIYVAPAMGFASCGSYGAACPDMAASFYENFPGPGSIDLSGTAGAENVIQMVFTGMSYVVAPGSSAWFAPGTGTNSMALVLADDANSPPITLPFTLNHPGGSATTIQVGSNGYVYLGTGTASRAYYGSVATVLTDGPRHSPFYGDLDPSFGGTVTYDEDPAGGTVYVTWDGVPEWNTGGATTATLQICLDAGGRVEYRYRDCQIAAAAAFVGFSPGNGARDPGAIDISAAIPFQTFPTDANPITLGCTGRPVIGGMPFSLDVADPNNNALAVLFLSLARTPAPGVSLASSFGGMETCFQHVAFPLVTSGLAIPMGGAASFQMSIPANPSLAGLSVFAQAGGVTVPAFATTSGFSATNGVELLLDNM